MSSFKNERFKVYTLNRYQDNQINIGNSSFLLGGDKDSGLYYDGKNLYLGGSVIGGAGGSTIGGSTGGSNYSFFIRMITKDSQPLFQYPTDNISNYNVLNLSFPEILKSLSEGKLVKKDQYGGGFIPIKNPINDPAKTIDDSDLNIKARFAVNGLIAYDSFRSHGLTMPINQSGNNAYDACYTIPIDPNGDIKNYISYNYFTMYDILKSLSVGELTRGSVSVLNPFSTNENNKADLCISAKKSKTSLWSKNGSRKSFSLGFLKFKGAQVIDSNNENIVNCVNDDGFFNEGYVEGEAFSLIEILTSLQTGHLCKYNYGYLQKIDNPVITQNLGSQPNPQFARYSYDLDLNARRLDNLTIHEIFTILENGEYQGRKLKIKAYSADIADIARKIEDA